MIHLRLEPRAAAPRLFTAVVTLGALVFAFVLSGLIIWLVGGDPIKSFGHIVVAAFGSIGVISDTLVKATPLILTGLACSLAFRMRLWNIGAEGQFLLGAWGASAVVLFPLVPAGTP
ncbi:MAG: ABC transporter permease, partial [Chloroflexota bacterium]